MSELKNSSAEQKIDSTFDEYIKNTVQKDEFFDIYTQDDINRYINKSTIKVKRYSYKQRKIIAILVLLLLISVGYNIYQAFFKDTTTQNVSPTSSQNIVTEKTTTVKKDKDEKEDKDKDKKENKVVDEVVENKVEVENTTTTNTITNTPNTNTTLVEKNIELSKDIDLNDLEAYLQNYYCVGLNRINYEEDTLESNTVLLLIAYKYFSQISAKNMSNPNVSYAQTTENYHKYLTELTGKDYSRYTSIRSYTNVIGFLGSSKSYAPGNNISIFDDERYIVSDIEVVDQQGKQYTGKLTIKRIVPVQVETKPKVFETQDEVTEYAATVVFEVNDSYSYQKYKIVSLKANNTSFYPDNTKHLVDNQ
mgnify:CR=1 FL=1